MYADNCDDPEPHDYIVCLPTCGIGYISTMDDLCEKVDNLTRASNHLLGSTHHVISAKLQISLTIFDGSRARVT